MTWGNEPPAAEPLTDDAIIAACLKTLHRYRPLGVEVSSRIVAARLARLAARGGAR